MGMGGRGGGEGEGTGGGLSLLRVRNGFREDFFRSLKKQGHFGVKICRLVCREGFHLLGEPWGGQVADSRTGAH